MDPSFLIIIVLFVGMMWLMSRGQRKQAAAAEQFRSTLEVGQNVMTHSGFYGRIVDIDGDAITLESMPGTETLWRRSAIAALADPPFAVVEDDEDAPDTADEPFADDVAPAPAVPDDASSLTRPSGATAAPPAGTVLPPTTPATGETDRPDDDAGRPPAR